METSFVILGPIVVSTWLMFDQVMYISRRLFDFLVVGLLHYFLLSVNGTLLFVFTCSIITFYKLLLEISSFISSRPSASSTTLLLLL